MPRKTVTERTAHLKTYEQYAPARGGKKGCPCEFEQWCRALVRDGWILCSAPDDKMLMSGRWTRDEFLHISTEACADVWQKGE